MASDTDIAWCAGFFDGEGHVSYRRSYPNPKTYKVSPALIVSVPQLSRNMEVLEFFKSTMGFGVIRGPYKADKSENTQHVYSCNTEEVIELLKILKPYLKSEKTGDFQRALMGYYTHDSKATEEDIARMIKHNKKKGCPECGNEWNGFVCSKCGYM